MSRHRILPCLQMKLLSAIQRNAQNEHDKLRQWLFRNRGNRYKPDRAIIIERIQIAITTIEVTFDLSQPARITFLGYYVHLMRFSTMCWLRKHARPIRSLYLMCKEFNLTKFLHATRRQIEYANLETTGGEVWMRCAINIINQVSFKRKCARNHTECQIKNTCLWCCDEDGFGDLSSLRRQSH